MEERQGIYVEGQGTILNRPDRVYNSYLHIVGLLHFAFMGILLHFLSRGVQQRYCWLYRLDPVAVISFINEGLYCELTLRRSRT